MNDLPLNNVEFYHEEEFLFGWHTYALPSFTEGQIIWLEISVYPTWKREPPKEMKLTRFEITDIEHSLQCIYGNDIMTTYKMEICIEPI
jgi:hypothetical protein